MSKQTNTWRQHLNPQVAQIKPYQPGKSKEQILKNNTQIEVIKLASNENSLGISPLAQVALEQLCKTKIARYPDANALSLREKLARKIGLEQNQIIIGNGSNEIIELISQLLLYKGATTMYSQHSFIVYKLATAAHHASGIEIQAIDYAHDFAAITKAAHAAQPALIFIANPNNPTGSHAPIEQIKQSLRQIPPSSMVLLDQAYREYAADDLTQTDEAIELLAEFDNLIITRTFSKIYGLAGLRIGYGLANQELITYLNRIRQPFNVNLVAATCALAALDDEKFVQDSRSMNGRNIAYLQAQFTRLGFSQLPSSANFISFAPCAPLDADSLNQSLLAQGIIARQLHEYQMPNHLRITIGTDDECKRFIDACDQALNDAQATS